MLGLVNILIALVAIMIAFYKWRFTYWKSRNVPQLEPSIPFGNFENPFRSTMGLIDIVKFWYDSFKDKGFKYGGVYFFASPSFLPVDLELIKNITTKDFNHFTDRGTFYDEKNDPLTAHLFALGGIKWRNLRIKLSPTFTSGKMRMMLNTVVDCSKGFKEIMDKMVDSDEAIDIKDSTSRFTTDVIGACAFGLECHSIADGDSPFRKSAKSILQKSTFQNLMVRMAISYPSLARAIGIKIVPEPTSKFFMNLVKTTVDYREKNDVRRNDFLQILIDLKNNKLDEEITEKHDGRSLTIEEVAAQCFVFFLAGFETSSTLMSFALFELAKNQKEQEQLRKEIKTVLDRHDGNVTYEGIGEMKYLQQVLDETLRLYPPLGFITRECVKDYKLPDDDVIVEKGTRCLISIQAIHHDKENYPDPEKFDPERFSDENKDTIPHHAFIPFGEGPRICIGMRFGYMQAKVGIITLLSNYKFTLSPKMQLPIKLESPTPIPNVKGGIWLKAERL